MHTAELLNHQVSPGAQGGSINFFWITGSPSGWGSDTNDNSTLIGLPHSHATLSASMGHGGDQGNASERASKCDGTGGPDCRGGLGRVRMMVGQKVAVDYAIWR